MVWNIRVFDSTNMRPWGGILKSDNLGIYECELRNYDSAVRHFLISAKMGNQDSLGAIKNLFTRGNARKSQYAKALMGCQDDEEP